MLSGSLVVIAGGLQLASPESAYILAIVWAHSLSCPEVVEAGWSDATAC